MTLPVISTAAPVVAIAFPLLLALVMTIPRLQPAASRIAPWAAVPALGLALGLPRGDAVELSWLIFGTTLSDAGETTRVFLLLTALLWFASGWFARAYLAADAHAPRFWVFFLLSMAGNVGLVLARDVVGFYAFFTLMTFAAYGVIVHEQTREARRAANVYFVLAFFGELLLLAAFLAIAGADVTVSLDDARRTIATSPHRSALVVLLLVGFGVKAGALGLHVWLPLAHPVAPTPASAVLSGAMIKAGLLGWLRFLPLGLASLEDLGWICAMVGFAGAVLAAVVGATQRKPKTVLAYSSVSQMGIMMMALGVWLGSPEASGGLAAAIAFFALHHALAKGSLFLGTAVAPATRRRGVRLLVFLGLVVPALSIAGAPLSSGAMAKIGMHDAIVSAGHQWRVLTTLLSIAAAGSTLIMLRFLLSSAPRAAEEEGEVPRAGLWLPWLALIAADLLVLFVAPAATPPLRDLVQGTKLWSATWPMLAGAAAAVCGWYATRLLKWSPVVPAGDVLHPVQALGGHLGLLARQLGEHARAAIDAVSALAPRIQHRSERFLQAVEGTQRKLGSYGVIGSLLAILLLLLLALLAATA